MRKPVHYPLPVELSFGRDINAKRKGRVAGYVWKDGREWFFETAGEASDGRRYRSEAAATQACLVADVQARDWTERERLEADLRAELARVRDTAKAQLDERLCMDVICNYRGPRGERYKVEFVAGS